MTTNVDYRRNLSLLFQHPMEPAFMAKGRRRTVFQMPDTFLADRYQSLGSQLTTRFGEDAEDTIQVKNISLPDISIPLQLSRHAQFSLFLPSHREMAGRLIDILMGMQGLDDLQSAAVYCRDHVNPYLFNYAMSVAMMHRDDTRSMPIPNIIESFPAKFIDSSILANVREEAGVIPDGSRAPILIPRNNTASDLDPEQRVAYFREDLGINLHHWHWHLVYPFTSNNRAIVEKDRRGELFYHMHKQVIARYNCERFSNRLARVSGYNDIRQPIAEGYFPKLDSTVASRAWPPRFANYPLADVNRPGDRLTINMAQIEEWVTNFRTAITNGVIVDNAGNQIQLDEERGIDILGNMMEASIITPNRNLYGDIHNMGHLLIAYAHDPDGRYMEGFGVMGDSGTAMRDPMFYRWHSYINEIFDLHKARLESYSVARLAFQEIAVTDVRVDVTNGSANELQTFWQQSDIDMSRGEDFGPRGAVFVRFTHLQHESFTYNIEVNNSTANQMSGNVRIFMAPRFDERGAAMDFNQQRDFMIELDKFRVVLRPGQNRIVRRSDESSVTIPYERTFRNLEANRPASGAAGELQFNICGCGWPQHMLIPKGTTEGLQMDLFVMISNYANDRINEDLTGICNDAESYCGVLNRRYPDRRPMGYPFDRNARNEVTTLNDFLTPNMRVQQVTIRYTDRTVVRAAPAPAAATQPNNQAN